MEAHRLKAIAKVKLAQTKKMTLFSTNTNDYELTIEILDTIEQMLDAAPSSMNVEKEITHILIEYLDDAINYEIMENMSNYGKVIANLAKYFNVVDVIQELRDNEDYALMKFEICLN